MDTLQVQRHEYKYLLRYDHALELQKKLQAILTVDQYSENGEYLVKSLYFDSVYQKDYHERMNGLCDRKKIRMRIYDESSNTAKLEVKYKSNQLQRKDSLLLTKDEAMEVISENYDILLRQNNERATQFYVYLLQDGYKPQTIIAYDRYAFVYPPFDTRITFDYNIRSQETSLDLFDKSNEYIPILNDFVVLEVKYNQHLASHIRNILSKYPLTAVSNSKYCLGRPIFAKYL